MIDLMFHQGRVVILNYQNFFFVFQGFILNFHIGACRQNILQAELKI